jgi:hypothetical protein
MSSQDLSDRAEGMPSEPDKSLEKRTSKGTSVATYSASQAATQIFVDDLAQTVSDSQKERSGRARVLRSRERLLYGCAAIAVCSAPLLVVIGTILIITGVAAAGGALLTAAGLLSGAAVRPLLRLQRETAAELMQIGKATQDDVRLYQRLRIIDQISDPAEREKALRELASAVAITSGQ